MAKLIIGASGAAQSTYELSAAIVTVGRAPENTIHIEDASVSSRHAQLHLVGEAFHLQDLDSTNGTRVNGQTVSSVALRGGDQIRFGKVEAYFESETPASSLVAPEVTSLLSQPAEVSALPADFSNASPFAKRKAVRDPLRLAAYAAAAVAIVALLASLLALAQMQPPSIP